MGETKCPPCTSEAARARRYRQRQRAGVQVVPVEVSQEIVDDLVAKRLLAPDDVGDSIAISQALSVGLKILSRVTRPLGERA